MTQPSGPSTGFEPRYPSVTAFGCTAVFVLFLCSPMFTGHFLIGPDSDQLAGGYAFRAFFTQYVRAHHAVPQWNPYIFGGMPFIAAPHGDTFYPTALLRLVMPTDEAMNATFLIHLVLAGFFTYLFLRGFGLPWLAAVGGGIAYELTGQVASLVNSGHDGKIIVSALLPLALWSLTKWMRDGKWVGVGVLALSTGGAILSPQLQMAYYLMLAAGLFALYLAFLDPDRPSRPVATRRLAGALGGVLLGSALSAVLVLPFLQYIPFSPRSDEGVSSGWLHATSWSMPPEELLDTLLPQFSGLRELYSGRNFFKQHSEYLGVVTLILASLGVSWDKRSRLRWMFVGLAAFFLTFALAGATPFFRLWYAILPMVSKGRAHSMAFYIVSFGVAVWAALGIERILAREVRRGVLVAWAIGLGGLVLLAATGVLSNIARAVGDPEKVQNVAANRGALMWGAFRVAAFGAAALAVIAAWSGGRMQSLTAGLAVLGLIGADLATIDYKFFVFSPRAAALFAPDAVTERISQTPPPYRVFDAAYGFSTLMAYGIPQALGYHGTELNRYDLLLGGKNVYTNLQHPQLWQLLALRYIVSPDTARIPGFHLATGPVTTSLGRRAYLYEAETPPPYARVVPAAAKLPEDQIVPTLLDPRIDYDRIVLFGPDQPVTPPAVSALPPPSPARATVTHWEPGRMTVALAPAPPAASYLLVSENWYLDWKATVDGAPVSVLRGDQTFVTVPVPAGARQVDLVFDSARYRMGKWISLLALVVALGIVGGALARDRANRG